MLREILARQGFPEGDADVLMGDRLIQDALATIFITLQMAAISNPEEKLTIKSND